MVQEITNSYYAKLSPDERMALSIQALEHLITSTREMEVVDEEGNKKKEILQPVTVLLKWIKAEAESIAKTTTDKEGNIPFEQPSTKEEAINQLQFFQKRYESLYTVLTILTSYFDNRENLFNQYMADTRKDEVKRKLDLVVALDLYHEQFISGLSDYFKAEPQKEYRNTDITPFIPDAIELPLSLLTLTPLQRSLLRIYLHDLRNLIGTPRNDIMLELNTKSDRPTLESHKKTIELVQKNLNQLFEFHKQFDFDTIAYRFIISPLHKFRGAVDENYRTTTQTEDETEGETEENPTLPKIKYSYTDHTRAALGILLQRETGNEKARPNIDEYSSYLSYPFLITLWHNCEQNYQRINNKLREAGEDPAITEAHATIIYELHEASSEGFVPDQMLTVDNGVKKGVWITFIVEDNGHGFPDSPSDEMFFDGEYWIRMFTPQENKSTHGGDGIGLATMQQNVVKAKGVFRTYTKLNQNKEALGACTAVSFPLLRHPITETSLF